MMQLGEVLTFLNKNSAQSLNYYTEPSLLETFYRVPLSKKHAIAYEIFYKMNVDKVKQYEVREKTQARPQDELVLEQSFNLSTKSILEECNLMPLVLKNYLKVSFDRVKELVDMNERGELNDEFKVGVAASTLDPESSLSWDDALS